MGKAIPPPATLYRDDPDRDDAASTSSAILLETIDYPDSAPPAYEDVPNSSRPEPLSVHEPQSYVTTPLSSKLLWLQLTLPHQIPDSAQPTLFPYLS